MTPATEKKLNQIMLDANAGNEIIPAFYQPNFGTSASIPAAIRAALKRGLLVQDGKDGCGNPKYKAAPVATNHRGNGMVN